MLIHYFRRSGEAELVTKPFLDRDAHGVVATRAPRRPNKIGLSIVRLISIQGNLLDGTPLLDIKPYLPPVDPNDEIRSGWLEGKLGDFQTARSDARFVGKKNNQ